MTVSSDSCWHDPIVRGGLVGAGVGGGVGGGVGAGVLGGCETVVVGFGLTVVVVTRSVVEVAAPLDRAVVVVNLLIGAVEPVTPFVAVVSALTAVLSAVVSSVSVVMSDEVVLETSSPLVSAVALSLLSLATTVSLVTTVLAGSSSADGAELHATAKRTAPISDAARLVHESRRLRCRATASETDRGGNARAPVGRLSLRSPRPPPRPRSAIVLSCRFSA